MTCSPCPWPTPHPSTSTATPVSAKHPRPTSELQPRPIKLSKYTSLPCPSHAGPSSSAVTMEAVVVDDAPAPGPAAHQQALPAVPSEPASITPPEHTDDRAHTQPQSPSSATSSAQSFEEQVLVLLPRTHHEHEHDQEPDLVEIASSQHEIMSEVEWADGAEIVSKLDLQPKLIDQHREQSTATTDHAALADHISLETPASNQSSEGDLDLLLFTPAANPAQLDRPPLRHEPPPAIVVLPKGISDSNKAATHSYHGTSFIVEEEDPKDIAALVIHTVGGRSFCSRAVTCDILNSTPAAHSCILKPEKINPFLILPASVTSTILEYACGLDPAFEGLQPGVVPSDDISTYWIHNLDFQVGESRLKAQEEAKRSLSGVCRMFRCLISPWKWHTLRVNPIKSCSQITSGLKYPLPDEPVHIERGGKEESGGQTVCDRKKAQSPEALTIGHLVKHLVFQPPLPTSDAMGTWLLNCPNLLHISFIRPNNPNIYPVQPDEDDDDDLLRIAASDGFLKEMANYIPMTVQSISGLHLPARAATHNPPGVSMTSTSNFFQDNVINLLNYARNLHTLSLSNINFTGSYGQRVLFVMTLNSRLLLEPVKKPEPLSNLSSPKGILNLDLGPGSIVDLGFMNGLKTAAPDLSHLHLQSGSTLNATLIMSRDRGSAPVSATSIGTELDLKEFLKSFCARLKSFSFVCSVTGPSTVANDGSDGIRRYCHHGVLDDVTQYCEELEALHITSDLITFNFFENLLSNETSNSSLKLRYLRIQFDYLGSSPLNSNDSTSSLCKYVELKRRQKILDFAKVAVDIKSSGIEWPTNSCWSRRDLLTRIRWLANERAEAVTASLESTASVDIIM